MKHFICDVCGLPGTSITHNIKRHSGECRITYNKARKPRSQYKFKCLICKTPTVSNRPNARICKNQKCKNAAQRLIYGHKRYPKKKEPKLKTVLVNSMCLYCGRKHKVEIFKTDSERNHRHDFCEKCRLIINKRIDTMSECYSITERI
jgi:hypothetical protein